MNLRPPKFFEPQANHVSCFANASGGRRCGLPPTPSSQVECLNIFSRVLIFFPGVGGDGNLFFSQGLHFFSRAYPSYSSFDAHLSSHSPKVLTNLKT